MAEPGVDRSSRGLGHQVEVDLVQIGLVQSLLVAEVEECKVVQALEAVGKRCRTQ